MTPRPPKQRSISDWITLGFLINEFWTGRESSIWEVWAAPAAPKTTPEGGGVAAHLLEWCLGPPGPLKPQNSTISGRPKKTYIKNPSVIYVGASLAPRGPTDPMGGAPV
jgi:hypothetical protein